MQQFFENRFRLTAYGTTAKREFSAGIATFLAMAYIIPVNANMLSLTGMPWGAVMLATILATAFGTLLMAFVANVPFAQAPGMGLNAFFTFTVVFGLGFTWQEALAMVLICGIVNGAIVWTGIRQKLMNAIPNYLKTVIGVAIGLFIAYIGIKNAGLLSFTLDPGTYATIPDGTIIGGSGAVPALVALNTPPIILALVVLLLMIVLTVKKVPGAILIAIATGTIIGVPFGYVNIDFASYFSTLGGYFGDLGTTFGQAFSAIGTLFADPTRIVTVVATIIVFSLTDIMDTIGTLIGAGSQLFSHAEMRDPKSRFNKAVAVDVFWGTSVGAILGTSNVTTFVESGVGISAGGRTGLTALTVSGLFLVSVILSPITQAVPGYAVAPALIIVGALMLRSIGKLGGLLEKPAIFLPTLATIAFMAFCYSITIGITFGLIFHCAIQLFLSYSERKETLDPDEIKTSGGGLNPVLFIMTGILILNLVISALM